MKSLTLKRITSDVHHTQGVLIDNHTAFALTLELPWKDNQKNISCIPDGRYVCKRIAWTFEIVDVPGRSDILFHKGNLTDDSEGCILIGEEFGYLNNEVAVISSAKGFNEFMNRLKKVNQFQINIISV